MIGAYTNPEPLRRMIQRAKYRRIDIVGCWNSEGLQADAGWDTAIQQAVGVDRYGIHATGCHSFCEGDGGAGSGVGYWDTSTPTKIINTTANGTLFTYGNARVTTAPAAQIQWLNWAGAPAGSFAPTKPLYIEAAASNATPTGLVVSAASPIPTTEALTWTFWGVNWGASGGSFEPIIRRSNSPFTVITTLGTVTYTGTNGTVKKTDSTLAADSTRTYPLGFHTHQGFNPTTMLGPLFLTYMRCARTNYNRGIAVTPFYSAGSRSAYDMWEALSALPQETYEHLFDAVCNYQGASLADHMAIIDIYEGSNQTGETGVSAGAPVQGTPAAAANYVYYITSIIAKIQDGWTTSGRNAENIVFRVACSHPTNDAAETAMIPYRAALRAGLAFGSTHKNVTLLDRAILTPLSQMKSYGDFADTVHLSRAGYIRHERKAWSELLAGSTRSVRVRSRPRVGIR